MSIFDKGVEFDDPCMGRMLAKNWGGEVWLFRKVSDGGGDSWITHRKCNKDDLQKLAGLIHEAHGPVMRKT